MQNKRFSFIALPGMMLMAGMLGVGCTDVVDIDLKPAADLFVVDAWINNKSEAQTIRLSMSQPYFDNVFTPGINGASVQVIRNATDTLEFGNTADGNYQWIPGPGETIGTVGEKFELLIHWGGETYVASSEMRRVPLIDSIHIEYRENELGFPDGHYASLFARDLPGLGDTYWIRAYKNGAFLNKPQELNLAYDASFDMGGEVDGLVFIPPIRDAINRFPDPDTEDDFDVPPYEPGDEVHVEIHSISNPAFYFLETARDQMSNGDNTIFSIPIANTRGNVKSTSSTDPVLGFFNVAAVSQATKVVQ